MPGAPHDLTQWKGAIHPNHRTLQGRYVRLEALDVAKHCNQLWQAFQTDSSLWDYMYAGPFAHVTDLEQYLKSRNTNAKSLLYAIIDMETGEAQGLITYWFITPEMGTLEIGHVAFGAPMQRTRKATETVFLLVDEAINALGYRRQVDFCSLTDSHLTYNFLEGEFSSGAQWVEWKCNNANARSKRAAERFGFRYEGISRQHMVVKGKNRDTAWFSIIDSEWPELRRAYVAWLSPDNFDANGMQRRKLQSLFSTI